MLQAADAIAQRGADLGRLALVELRPVRIVRLEHDRRVQLQPLADRPGGQLLVGERGAVGAELAHPGAPPKEMSAPSQSSMVDSSVPCSSFGGCVNVSPLASRAA